MNLRAFLCRFWLENTLLRANSFADDLLVSRLVDIYIIVTIKYVLHSVNYTTLLFLLPPRRMLYDIFCFLLLCPVLIIWDLLILTLVVYLLVTKSNGFFIDEVLIFSNQRKANSEANFPDQHAGDGTCRRMFSVWQCND